MPGNGASALWFCRCDCGKTRLALHRSLRLGRVKACTECREIPNGWTTNQEVRLRDLDPTTDTPELPITFSEGKRNLPA